MVEISCPWCTARLAVAFEERDTEHACPECQTTWSYVEPDEERGLAIAA